ncbi:TetR family transcriptional regulator [Novosphingobium sp. PhB165]|uniref:TetR/AcrR family transcriptional regulator n=1 Tax=Novosphingobium sp. PhB165 TaxID=2485105 RepID=UPI001053CC91|nr:TetR/AcrR family transcriptional regulator [Novosphingobium sp. PhB165]TCM20731.1 TetR family transcriptional regulator [Novosphingobium sp. PhB165]
MVSKNQRGTREDAAVRRAQIIDEAIRQIGQIGSRGFTIQGLASKCGISNAGLLYYFGSKDGVLMALIDEIERREEVIVAPLVAATKKSSGNGKDAYLAMVRLLRRIIERYREIPELGRFLIILQTDAMDPAHPAHDWFLARAEETETLFAQLLQSWAEDPEETARICYALIFGLARRWYDKPESFDLGATLENTIRALVPFER